MSRLEPVLAVASPLRSALTRRDAPVQVPPSLQFAWTNGGHGRRRSLRLFGFPFFAILPASHGQHHQAVVAQRLFGRGVLTICYLGQMPHAITITQARRFADAAYALCLLPSNRIGKYQDKSSNPQRNEQLRKENPTDTAHRKGEQGCLEATIDSIPQIHAQPKPNNLRHKYDNRPAKH